MEDLTFTYFAPFGLARILVTYIFINGLHFNNIFCALYQESFAQPTVSVKMESFWPGSACPIALPV